MPALKLGLKRRTHKYNVCTRDTVLVVVELLDHRTIECSLHNDSLAHECLDIVINRLQIHEPQYFGVMALDKHNRWRWLEPDKPLRKQLYRSSSGSQSPGSSSSGGSYLLKFGVMHYVPNVMKLQYRSSRQLYFLQVKRLVSEGALPCSLDMACLLASLSLQAEFGDYSPHIHDVRFLQQLSGLFPSKLYGSAPDELFEKIIKLYKDLSGMPQSMAEIQYLTEAQQIEDYSIEYIPATTLKDKQHILLGTSTVGLTIRHVNNNKRDFISWSRIHQMNYKQCTFYVIRLDKHPNKEMRFSIESVESCRYLWWRSIANHKLFRQSLKINMYGPLESSTNHSAAAVQSMAVIGGAESEYRFMRKPSLQHQPAAPTAVDYRPRLSNPENGPIPLHLRQTSRAVESPLSLRFAYPDDSGGGRQYSDHTYDQVHPAGFSTLPTPKPRNNPPQGAIIPSYNDVMARRAAAAAESSRLLSRSQPGDLNFPAAARHSPVETRRQLRRRDSNEEHAFSPLQYNPLYHAVSSPELSHWCDSPCCAAANQQMYQLSDPQPPPAYHLHLQPLTNHMSRAKLCQSTPEIYHHKSSSYTNPQLEENTRRQGYRGPPRKFSDSVIQTAAARVITPVVDSFTPHDSSQPAYSTADHLERRRREYDSESECSDRANSLSLERPESRQKEVSMQQQQQKVMSTWSISPLSKFKSSDRLDCVDIDLEGGSGDGCPEQHGEDGQGRFGDSRRSIIQAKLNNVSALEEEFNAIVWCRPTASFSVAKAADNYSRNRSSHALPYDDTRVKLLTCPGANPSGYINASWVKARVAGTTFRYIVTQTPLQSTCCDFWQMVWERQAALVVSLSSNESEPPSPSGVGHYRPMRAGQSLTFANLVLTAQSVQRGHSSTATTIKMKNKQDLESRVLWHLHFPHVHDEQSAASVRAAPLLIAFINEIRSIRQHLKEEGMQSLPIVVHCDSGGNGPSGALVLAEIMLTCIEHDDQVDVARVLTFLRYQRANMVQSLVYYQLVHRVLGEALSSVRLI